MNKSPQYKHTTPIARWNELEATVSTLFQTWNPRGVFVFLSTISRQNQSSESLKLRKYVFTKTWKVAVTAFTYII